MVSDQKAFTGGNCPAGNVSVYLCWLPSRVWPSLSVRLAGYIASAASLPYIPPFAPAARFNQLPLKKALSPNSELTRQPLIALPALATASSTFFSPSFMPKPTSSFLLQRQVLEVEGFAGSDADTGELRA